MLLQTLVQLNILILATPALAGWTYAAGSAGRRARRLRGLQGRAVETVAPKPNRWRQSRTRNGCVRSPLVLPRFAVPSAARPADQVSAFFAAPTAALVSFNPFPHATRAP